MSNITKTDWYAHIGGVECPVCSSTVLKPTDDLVSEGRKAYQSIECSSCGASWVDEYTLSGFTELKNCMGEGIDD